MKNRLSLTPAARTILTILFVVAIGLAQLWVPLDGDQTFFLHTARAIDSGSVLYRDIWDVKQPGIFLFYLASGRLFGFNEFGVNLLELIWMTAMCGVTLWWGKRLELAPRLCFLAPLFTVGAYFLADGPWQFDQIEGLVGLPLLLAAGLSLERRGSLQFLAGVAGGVVLCFKVALGVMLLPAWLVAAWSVYAAGREGRWPRLGRLVLLTLAGCAVPLGLTALWAWQGGFLRELAWTTFVFPIQFAREEGARHFYAGSFRLPENLFNGVKWFGFMFGSLLFLGLVGAREILRRSTPYRVQLLVLLLAAAAAVLAQTWWLYQFLLLLPPLGLLACLGAEGVARLARTALAKAACLVVLAALLAMPLLYTAGLKTTALMHHWPFDHWPFNVQQNRFEYQSELFPFRRASMNEVQFIREPDALPGPIYAPERPFTWAASGRQLITIPFIISNSFLTAEQRTLWVQTIMSSRPAYLRLSGELRERLNRIDPGFQHYLDSHYRRVEGHMPWYVRAD